MSGNDRAPAQRDPGHRGGAGATGPLVQAPLNADEAHWWSGWLRDRADRIAVDATRTDQADEATKEDR